MQAFHLGLLHEYVGANEPIDVWTITTPFVSGSAGGVPRSNLLPPNANPTLRRMLENYKYIYWVSTNTTNQITGNNLPFAASVTDLFFENGGEYISNLIASSMFHMTEAIAISPCPLSFKDAIEAYAQTVPIDRKQDATIHFT